MHSTVLNRELHEGLERMQALRDEVRLIVHLAGMDGKQVWDKLEPQLDAIEHAAKDFTATTHVAVTNAIRALTELKASVRA